MEETPAVSPDGGKVAFVARVNGRRQIFLRLLATGVPEPITRKDVDHSFPRWADEDTLIFFVHPEDEGEPGSIWETDYLGSTAPKRVMQAQGEADVDPASRTIATFREDDDPARRVNTRRCTARDPTWKRAGRRRSRICRST